MEFFDNSPYDEDRHYDYLDFLTAIKKLPDAVSTVAVSEWMQTWWGDKEKRQAVINKYVKWSKTRTWERNPWEQEAQFVAAIAADEDAKRKKKEREASEKMGRVQEASVKETPEGFEEEMEGDGENAAQVGSDAEDTEGSGDEQKDGPDLGFHGYQWGDPPANDLKLTMEKGLLSFYERPDDRDDLSFFGIQASCIRYRFFKDRLCSLVLWLPKEVVTAMKHKLVVEWGQPKAAKSVEGLEGLVWITKIPELGPSICDLFPAEDPKSGSWKFEVNSSEMFLEAAAVTRNL